MEKAKITIEHTPVMEGKRQTNVFEIPDKHLGPLFDWLRWAQKQETLAKKRQSHDGKKPQ